MIGCESSNDDSPTGLNGNSAPVIHSVTANPSTVTYDYLFNRTELSSVATDADGDSISYNWSSMVGSFSDGNLGQSVTWYADETNVGIYFIQLIASDGIDIARDSVSVEIVPQ